MIDHDISPLADPIAMRPYETGTSLVARRAAMEHAAHGRQFANDFYVNFERLAGGDPGELRKVSILLSADYDELRRWTPRRVGDGFELGGEIITNYRSRRTRFRVCPMCAVEDVAAAPGLQLDAAVSCSAFTLVDPIRTCFIHGAALVQVADSRSAGYHHHDFSLAIADALEDWDSLTSNAVLRRVTTFEWYLLGRLGFSQRMHVELADELDITDITTLSQYMGLFILRGRTAVLGDLDEDGLWQAAEIGFEVLSGGERGVRQFVTDAYDRAVADGERGMSSTIFDRFHYFLTSGRSVGHFLTVKQIIIDRLSELVPYGPDDAPTFGVKASKRYWHTLLSAERQYGIPYRTIQKRAERAGLITRLNADVQKTRALIDAKKLDRLLDGGNVQANRFNAAKFLGADWQYFAAFEEAGVLFPVARGTHQHNSIYLQRDLNDLAARLLLHTVQQDGEVDGMVSMWQAYVMSDWSLPEVVDHVVQGNVSCSSITGMQAVASVRVDIEALRALHPLHGVEVMTVPEAAAAIGVSQQVISKLILKERMPRCRQRHPQRNGNRLVVPRAVVEAFRHEYVPVSEIWRRGVQLSCIARTMEAHGFEPAFKSDELRCLFYHRHEADLMFPPL